MSNVSLAEIEMSDKGWHNGGTSDGKLLAEIRVIPAPQGIIEARLPGYDNYQVQPIKNIGKVAITVHCSMTGKEIHIIPNYLTMLVERPEITRIQPSK